jgi:hypothetical protein
LSNDKFGFLTKVSKDVKKVRQFEEGLLRNYQRYLEILEQTIKGELLAACLYFSMQHKKVAVRISILVSYGDTMRFDVSGKGPSNSLRIRNNVGVLFSKHQILFYRFEYFSSSHRLSKEWTGNAR